jgi:hypothetical protein
MYAAGGEVTVGLGAAAVVVLEMVGTDDDVVGVLLLLPATPTQ